MKKGLFILLFSLFLGCVEQPDNPVTGLNYDEESLNILVIGWDGVQRNVLIELLEKDQLPNLKTLTKTGSIISMNVETCATDTKAGWSELLTGYSCGITGVYSNNVYMPIPAKYTVFERLENHLGDSKIKTIFLSGKSYHVGGLPPIKKYELEDIKERSEELMIEFGSEKRSKVIKTIKKINKSNQRDNLDIINELRLVIKTNEPEQLYNKTLVREVKEIREMLLNQYGMPFYNSRKKIDIWDVKRDPRSWKGIIKKALEYLDKNAKKRFFFFFHFREPDSVGHVYGEGSDEYRKSIILMDKLLGRIREKLDEMNQSKNTLIYVVSDHGFDYGGYDHHKAPHTFLATNDPEIVRNGDRKDFTPTILSKYSIKLEGITPLLEGSSLTEKPGSKGLKKETYKEKADNKDREYMIFKNVD